MQAHELHWFCCRNCTTHVACNINVRFTTRHACAALNFPSNYLLICTRTHMRRCAKAIKRILITTNNKKQNSKQCIWTTFLSTIKACDKHEANASRKCFYSFARFSYFSVPSCQNTRTFVDCELLFQHAMGATRSGDMTQIRNHQRNQF